jgi:hypothetical protein
LPGGGNEFTLALKGFHESFCADIPTETRSLQRVVLGQYRDHHLQPATRPTPTH